MIAILGKVFISYLKSTNNRNLQFLSFQKIYTLLGFLLSLWRWNSGNARLSFGVYWYLKRSLDTVYESSPLTMFKPSVPLFKLCFSITVFEQCLDLDEGTKVSSFTPSTSKPFVIVRPLILTSLPAGLDLLTTYAFLRTATSQTN